MFLGRVQKVQATVTLATCQIYKELNLLKYLYYMILFIENFNENFLFGIYKCNSEH